MNGHNTRSDPGGERSRRPLEEVDLIKGLENGKTSRKGAAGVPGLPQSMGKPQASHNPSKCLDFLIKKLGAESVGQREKVRPDVPKAFQLSARALTRKD